ncbi:MAG: SDR family oxidoreductase [Bacteroides sp.]|nr:SDR family oxidoreductase [Bacteroides sp.]
MEITFKDKVALVTGAAVGIGWTAARMFAEAGASVVLIDMNKQQVEERANELIASGHQAIGLACDVSKEEEVKAVIEQAVATFGRIDAAYNNAGIHAAVREELADTEGWDFDHVMAVNLRGIWNCMKYELMEMKKQSSGAIVNCSSQGGVVGIPYIGAYTASKHAILGLTKSTALEYARLGIRINAICPGTCDTPMVRHACEMSPDHMARVIDAIPLGRVGKPEEIAAMVLLLCSDYAGFAIGQTWEMDGGYTVM